MKLTATLALLLALPALAQAADGLIITGVRKGDTVRFQCGNQTIAAVAIEDCGELYNPFTGFRCYAVNLRGQSVKKKGTEKNYIVTCMFEIRQFSDGTSKVFHHDEWADDPEPSGGQEL